tara:strand:+ start:1860 stop:2033 length:174 start_codon:yes stop_codon:yes gene_type:complete
MRAKVNILLNIDAEEFIMPVDNNPTEELHDMIEDSISYIEGVSIININVKCTGRRTE